MISIYRNNEQFDGAAKMDDVSTYQVTVYDGIDEVAFNATSPVQTKITHPEPSTTSLIVHADQAALIGLLRHLHQQGYLLLSVCRQP